MLPLLPELQVLSHLVAVGDRVTRACSVSHRRAPAPQGWSPALSLRSGQFCEGFLVSVGSGVALHDLSAAEAALESSSWGLSTAFSLLVWHWLYFGVYSFREDFEVHQLPWVE